MIGTKVPNSKQLASHITQHQYLTPFTGYLSSVREQIIASAESKVLIKVRIESTARV
jgi:hypothetical protein